MYDRLMQRELLVLRGIRPLMRRIEIMHPDESKQSHVLPLLPMHPEMLDEVDDLDRLGQYLAGRENLKSQYDQQCSEHTLNVVEMSMQKTIHGMIPVIDPSDSGEANGFGKAVRINEKEVEVNLSPD